MIQKGLIRRKTKQPIIQPTNQPSFLSFFLSFFLSNQFLLVLGLTNNASSLYVSNLFAERCWKFLHHTYQGKSEDWKRVVKKAIGKRMHADRIRLKSLIILSFIIPILFCFVLFCFIAFKFYVSFDVVNIP